jgi:hypothetical protein
MRKVTVVVGSSDLVDVTTIGIRRETRPRNVWQREELSLEDVDE